MRGLLRALTLLVLAAVTAVLTIHTHKVSAQTTFPPPAPSTQPAGTIYNPYPPGILPSNLDSELARVRSEVTFIENEAIAQWRALPPPVLTGQPPTLQGTGQRANQLLGKLMNFDETISPFKDKACGSCHMPYAAFSGPIPSVNLTMIAYPGSESYRAGKRSAQRYTYAPFYPVLQYNATQQLFFGGNFWDARATGYLLGSPDAEQAQHPPVDTQEHMLPDTACIAYRLSQAIYRPLFEIVWGAGSFNITFPSNAEQICDTPGGAAFFAGSTTPMQLSPQDRTTANNVFDHWANSLDQYEASPDVSAFSSKFDAYLKNLTTLTSDEMAGMALFNGKGNCNSCHVDGRGTTSGSNSDTTTAASVTPKFTCYGTANEGLPLNPADAFYYQTTPDAYGFTGNPYGFGYRDLGIGTFLRSGPGAAPNPNFTWTQYAPMVDGEMQVSTARNVALTPPQCPTTEAGVGKPYFQKEFFHNGYIKSLKQLVHFYNTRDVCPSNVTSGHCPAGTVERVNCWPLPEVPGTVDMTTGMLGLTDTEENQIVAFLETLSDGFVTPYPDINTFTGTCGTCNPATDANCSPSTQGNGSLIQTPQLPACASAICAVAPLPNPPIH